MRSAFGGGITKARKAQRAAPGAAGSEGCDACGGRPCMDSEHRPGHHVHAGLVARDVAAVEQGAQRGRAALEFVEPCEVLPEAHSLGSSPAPVQLGSSVSRNLQDAHLLRKSLRDGLQNPHKSRIELRIYVEFRLDRASTARMGSYRNLRLRAYPVISERIPSLTIRPSKALDDA